MNFIYSTFRCILCLLCLLQNCEALYEDQIGKFDWKQEYVGFVNKFVFDIKSSGRKVIVGTKENVLAAIDPRDGTIFWRQLLETGEDGRIDDIYQNKDVITTLSGGGKFVRMWDSNSGLLINEHAVSFSSKTDKDTNLCGFNLNEQIAYKVNMKQKSGTDERPLFQIVTHYVNRENQQEENHELLAPWLNANTKCIITWKSLLVCADISTKTMYSYNLKNMQIINDDSIDSGNTNNLIFQTHKFELEGVNLNDKFEISQPIDNHILLKFKDKNIHFLYRIQKQSVATDIDMFVADYFVLSQFQRFSNVVDSGVVELNNNFAYYSLSKTSDQNNYEVSIDIDSQMKVTAGHFSLPTDTGSILLAGLHVFYKKDGGIGYRLLLSTSDHALIMINSSGKLMWKREESLASILNVEMLELPVSDTEARFEEEFGVTDDNIINMFIHRIKSQIYQCQSFINSLINYVAIFISSSPPDINSIRMTHSGNRQQLIRDEFNLHKIIVVTTSSGKLFGIDNLSGTVLWTRFLEELSCIKSSLNNKTKWKLPLFVQRTTAHFPHRPQCAVLGVHEVTGNSVLYVFDPITGNPIGDILLNRKPGLIMLPFHVIQVAVLQYHNDHFLKPLLMLDSNELGHVFPDSCTSIVSEKRSSIYLFSADVSTGFIRGYGFQHSTQSEIIATKLWTITLPTKSQKITHVVTKRSIERVHSQGRVMGDRSVLYKYLNPNLAVIVTEGIDVNLKPYINMYLIDGVTGNIVHGIIHRRVHGPVHVVHSENWIVYSYFNEKYRRTDVAVLELFEGKTQGNTTIFSSLHPPLLNIVEKQAYIFPMSGISAMSDTITDKGMTSKHILVALPTGAILEIPKFFLDPRRPIVMTPELREEGLMPYIPELPIPTEHIINYNQSVVRVTDIYTAPAGLESTSLVFVYGLDLFYTRTTPSKTFDVLKDDFDHYFIAVVLFGLIAASYLTKRLAAHKALKQAWK